MAEKILNTRVAMKYDTLENWNNSSLILKSGELAIAEIPTTSSNSGLTPPAIGIKVGNGADVFSGLSWIQAIAGDVNAWAKAATKPTYNANEIEGLEDFIAGEIDDTDTTYQIIAGTGADDKKWFLQKQAKGTTTWTTVSTIDLTNLSDDIEFNTAYNATTNKAATMTDITNAVEALDVTNITGFDKSKTLATLTETDGKIAATFQDIEITLSHVTDAGDAASKDLATAISATSTNGEIPTADVVYEYVEDKLRGLSGALLYIGVATVPITDHSTTDPAITGYDFSKAATGDVIVYEHHEFVWDGSEWRSFGSGDDYAMATVTITGANGLTGGGSLEENRVISHATAPAANASGVTGHGYTTLTPTNIGRYLQGISVDTYGHVAEVKTALLPAYTLTQDATDGHKLNWGIQGSTSEIITIPDEDTKYTFAEGTTDGAFSVTPTGGTAQTVKVHGLHDIAISGNVNDLEQTAGDVLVLNCGTSTTVI